MISVCPFALTPELIIAIATLVLAVVTAWMAWETRIAAKTATKALTLEQMPILGVRDLRSRTTWSPGNMTVLGSITVGIELFNAGRVPVKFKVKHIAVTLANLHTSTGEFASSGGRVLPGASSIFWYPTWTFNPPIFELPPTVKLPSIMNTQTNQAASYSRSLRT